MKSEKLWTRNFRLVILASAMGTVGSIAGGFALAFLVFDETGSTLVRADRGDPAPAASPASGFGRAVYGPAAAQGISGGR